MEATIEVAGLRKRFGSTLALAGMSFIVQPGQVTGFVGPNGAGKSTTMRVILGLDAPDQGSALISGQPYRKLRRPLSHIGAMLDAAALQPGRTARNHLLWLAHSQGLGGRRVDEVMERAGLTSAARRKAGGFSLGMRQRLGIAAALLGDPPVLMLDEPFNGMDPEGIVWMRGYLRTLAAEGRAAHVVDAPFSGTPDNIRAGTLTVLLGGAKEDVDRVEPAVRAYAGTVIRTGDLGSALVLKLVNNIVFAANVQVALEVARLAEQAGMPMSSLYEVFAASSGGTKAIGVMERFGAPQAFADQVRPFMVKDVAACEQVAAEIGVDLGLLGRVARGGRLDVSQP